MALESTFVGSGEFVSVREWSCPLHDDREVHVCDCDHCTLPYYICETCKNGEWVDVQDANGVVMRELSNWEVTLREQSMQMLTEVIDFHGVSSDAKVTWLEDNLK